MTNEPQPYDHAAHTLRGVLRTLRAMIRAYVWTEGLAVIVATVVALFWLLLAVDWLFEPTVAVRAGLLAVSLAVLAAVALRWLVLPALRPLTDRSMAVLIERRFGGFEDSLITAVEMADRYEPVDEYGRQMFAHTVDSAAERVPRLALGYLFKPTPLLAALAAAVLLLLTVGTFALAAHDAFLFGVRRLAMVTNESWPRDTRLVIEGFPKGEAVVAKGADLEVVVLADTSMRVPQAVEIRYEAADGNRNRVHMVREGNAGANDDWQPYRHVFQAVLAPLEFEVRGGDARLRDLRVRVVENPAIEMSLDCVFPGYTHLAARRLPVGGTVPLPRGTQVTVHATSNKPLVRVYVDYPQADGELATQTLDLSKNGGSATEFEFALPPLDADTVVSFTLQDTDGVTSREPTRLVLTAVNDEAPQVAVRLQGIGSAITPQARLPLVGAISDDYGVARAAVEYVVDDTEPERLPFSNRPQNRAHLDVAEVFNVQPLELKPGQKLLVGTTAADDRHLPDSRDPQVHEPNQAQGERFLLDVVTPEQLRAMLESRELNLRQRYEAILAEVIGTRDSVAGLQAAPGAEESVDAATLQSQQRLTLSRAVQNSQKNGEEVLGVATSFDDIRFELVNNRVDTEELRVRLQDYIAEPLRQIGGQMFPQFEERLHTLETTLLVDEVDAEAARSAQQATVAQADAILVAMEQVRSKMLELETFNEALDILREIIASQQDVSERTGKLRGEKLRSLLE